MRRLACMLALMLGWMLAGAPVALAASGAGTGAAPGSSIQILQSFGNQDEGGVLDIPVKRRHEVLFWMGLALLVLVLATGGLGIAMGVFGKEVFVWHMLLAGLSMTLAVAHAIVAVVWFWPYK